MSRWRIGSFCLWRRFKDSPLYVEGKILSIRGGRAQLAICSMFGFATEPSYAKSVPLGQLRRLNFKA
jgi:hypothetical protein